MQPLDVSVNAIFKKKIRKNFVGWLEEKFDDITEDISGNKYFKAPSKDLIIKWTIPN